MEFCPRCTSTVADDAQTCPSCGAAIWQPESPSPHVAVTPAPVALVLPAPAAAPPPLPATAAPPLPSSEQLSLPMPVEEQAKDPEPSPNAPGAPPTTPSANGNGNRAPQWVPTGHDPQVHSVVVNLPPQRIAPVEAATEPLAVPESPISEPVAAPESPAIDAAPPAPPVQPATVVPATPPTHRKPGRVAIAVGTIAPLLAVVVLIVALPAHGAKPKHAAIFATDEDAQFDLRALAAAEETNLTATESYATDSAALDAAGYQPVPGKPVTISAGISKSGYCLVASNGAATARWYLYDSKQGGLLSTGFAAEALAQRSCADSAITSYLPIT